MKTCSPVQLQHGSDFSWDLNLFNQCATADLGSKVPQFSNTAIFSSLNTITIDLNSDLVSA